MKISIRNPGFVWILNTELVDIHNFVSQETSYVIIDIRPNIIWHKLTELELIVNNLTTALRQVDKHNFSLSTAQHDIEASYWNRFHYTSGLMRLILIRLYSVFSPGTVNRRCLNIPPYFERLLGLNFTVDIKQKLYIRSIAKDV